MEIAWCKSCKRFERLGKRKNCFEQMRVLKLTWLSHVLVWGYILFHCLPFAMGCIYKNHFHNMVELPKLEHYGWRNRKVSRNFSQPCSFSRPPACVTLSPLLKVLKNGTIKRKLLPSLSRSKDYETRLKDWVWYDTGMWNKEKMEVCATFFV